MQDGHHHFRCFSVLVCVDVFGLIVRVDMCTLGSCHDRWLFTQTGPQMSPTT